MIGQINTQNYHYAISLEIFYQIFFKLLKRPRFIAIIYRCRYCRLQYFNISSKSVGVMQGLNQVQQVHVYSVILTIFPFYPFCTFRLGNEAVSKLLVQFSQQSPHSSRRRYISIMYAVLLEAEPAWNWIQANADQLIKQSQNPIHGPVVRLINLTSFKIFKLMQVVSSRHK